MRKNRVNMFMEVTFNYGDESFKEEVYIPFPIFIEAVRKFFDSRMVTLDGTDNAIWNMLVDLDCLDSLEDNEDIQKYCKEFYAGSEFEEEDYADWKDDYEMDHGLGEYAIEED